MNSWQLAAAKESYKEAISATASLTKDARPVGFIAPHEFPTNQADTHIQRQNNTLIHLLVQSIEEIKTLKDQIQRLSDKVSTLEKGKAVTLPPDAIDQLSAQLKSAKFGESKAIKGKGKGAFRVWKQ